MTGRLHELGMRYLTDKATHHGYCDFYQEHLPGKVTRLLEIGIMDGASLRMWRDFYPGAEIIGVDINQKRSVGGCTVLWGDATSAAWLAENITGEFDVIVDDGSHMTADQQTSFDLLWPQVAPGGVYVLEDLHTSFMENYCNAEESTFDWLERAFRSGELTGEFFLRDESDPTDSVTSVIFKPAMP